MSKRRGGLSVPRKQPLVGRAAFLALYRDEYWDACAVELDLLLQRWRRDEPLVVAELDLALAPQLLVLAMYAKLHDEGELLDDFEGLLARCQHGTPAPASFCTFHASIMCIKWGRGEHLPYDPRLGGHLEARLRDALVAWRS